MTRSSATHRERLIAATIAATARYGYRETSIARIVAGAKVSRATFYANFADKEDCFLAACRVAAERIAGGMERFETERGTAIEAREILRRLLENADREPAVARVFLIEALAAGPVVRAERERFINEVEAWLDAFLSSVPDGLPQLEIPARSLLGAVGGVIAIRAFRGETGRLVDLLDEIDPWLRAHAIEGRQRRDRFQWAAMGEGMGPPVEPAPSPLDQRLPRGRAALPAAAVAGAQRLRAIAAVAHLAQEKGYDSTTVADIVATAGIGREAFYEHFRGKEDAFLTAQSYALETSLSMASAEFFGAGSWQERVWNAALPMLEFISSVPDLTALDFIESYAAGPESIRRSFESRMAYTLFLEEGYRQRPEAEGLPRLSSELIAGAILEPMRRLTVAHRVGEIKLLAPQVVYVALAPFIGPEEALELIEREIASKPPGTPSGRSPSRPRAG